MPQLKTYRALAISCSMIMPGIAINYYPADR